MKSQFVYSGIRVANMERSLEFYTKLLGMKLISRTKIPETKGEIANLKSKGSDQTLELNHYESQPYNHGDELDHLAFKVDDLEEMLRFLESKGVKRIYDIVRGKEARWTYVADPDGIWIELFDYPYLGKRKASSKD
jgi:lactoylglutathione lyase